MSCLVLQDLQKAKSLPRRLPAILLTGFGQKMRGAP